MRDIPYEEQLKEAQKPIYAEMAKYLWDNTYAIYKSEVPAYEISGIVDCIIECIDIETKKNLECSIFNTTNNIEKSLLLYEKKIDEKHVFLKDYIPLFSRDDKKYKSFLDIFSYALQKIDKDLLLIVRGGFLNFMSNFNFLSKYTCSQLAKSIRKEFINGIEQWVMGCDNNKTILENMAFVWPPRYGFSRFITVDGKWGFIDVVSEEKHIMPDYVHSMGDLHSELACYLDMRTQTYGYINYKGQIMIQPDFACFANFMDYSNIACTRYCDKKYYELTRDKRRKDIFGDDYNMSITVLSDRNYITIKKDGSLTKDLQEQYDTQRLNYEREYQKQLKANRSYYYGDDEDDIMNALAHGEGDIFGF